MRAYDVSAYKVELAALFHELQRPWIMQPVLHSTTAGVISQIQECAKSRPTLVFNLCDGYDEVGVPGLSVVKALELADLPFTGANSRYYETSCSKIEIERVVRQSRRTYCRMGSAPRRRTTHRSVPASRATALHQARLLLRQLWHCT